MPGFEKFIKWSVLVFIAFSSFLSPVINISAQRTIYNFNNDWKLLVGDSLDAKNIFFDDASWKPVTLPRAWNEDEAFKKDIVDLSTGIAWYRKHFKLPASEKGKKIFIEFEGVRQAAVVYINGKEVGLHENGVTAFGFDISGLVNFGEEKNIIAVRIDNAWNYKEKATGSGFQWSDRNFNVNYGGITKNVYLHIKPKVYQTLPLFTNLGTTGNYVYAKNIDVPAKVADIFVESQVKNESGLPVTVQLEVAIIDADGKLVKTFTGNKNYINQNETLVISANSQIKNINFWSWGYGYLYDVKTTLRVNGEAVEQINTKTGFRKTDFKNGMVYLNGRVIQIKGYAQRTSNEWPAIGLSVPAWLSDYNNKLMVESNANLVRWMHITPWRQDVESCDRVGLMQAMPAGDAEKDVDGRRWEQRKEVMRDAMIYFRNNPSIIFYECGNESISEAHMKEMKPIRNQYDPYGGRAIGSREMLDSKEAEYGGEMLYINKSSNIPVWAMEYSRDEGLRKYWDEFSPPYHKNGDGPLYKGQYAGDYNRNMDSHAIENIERWFEYWKQRPGTGSRISSGGVNIIFSESNTHHRGELNYRTSGEVDAMRIPKQNYYANKIMWDGWVDIAENGIHIIGHWNYKKGVVKNIYVISNSEKVKLFVNGKSMGDGLQSNRFLYTFKNVAWAPGTIVAKGFDKKGKETCKTSITTSGEPAGIRLTEVKRPQQLLANGHDVTLLEFEVVDAKGNRCPTALNMVDFTLEGPGEWRGGIAQGPENYILSKSIPVEDGVNRILVRSTTTPGKITVKAASKGLKDDAISFTSVPFNNLNGLSTMFMADA